MDKYNEREGERKEKERYVERDRTSVINYA